MPEESQEVLAERERCRTIIELARQRMTRELLEHATRAIANGDSAESFRARVRAIYGAGAC
jgi:hypothetical protein